MVELSSGRIALAPQLPGWEGLPLGSRLAGPSGGRPSPPGHGPAARLRRAWSWARGASLVTVSVRFPGRASLSPLRRPHRSRLSGSPKSASVSVQGLLSFRCDPREPMGAVSALLRAVEARQLYLLARTKIALSGRFGRSPFAPPRRAIGGGAPFEAGKDAQVPDDDGTDEHDEVLRASGQAAPATSHVSCGGVLERRETALDSGAPGI